MPRAARLTRQMKLLLAAIFATCLASLPTQQVAACSCAGFGEGPRAAQQAAEVADAAFAGTVVGEAPVAVDLGGRGVAATVPFPPAMGQTIYTFEVDGVAKGPIGARVEVLAGGDGASCGFSFGMGERWLVFTTWDGAMHATGLCSGNTLLDVGADPLLPLTAPTDDEADAEAEAIPTPILALLAIAAAVAGVSWLAFRRGPPVSG